MPIEFRSFKPSSATKCENSLGKWCKIFVKSENTFIPVVFFIYFTLDWTASDSGPNNLLNEK